MAVFALVGGHFTPDRRVLWRFCSRGARTNPSSPGEPVLERSEPARINAVKAIDTSAIVNLMVVNINAGRLALPFAGVAALAL